MVAHDAGDDATSRTDSRSDDGGFGTAINAVLGAIVGVVLPFPPVSYVLGGAISGYLQGPDLRDGTVVGAVAGVLSSLFWVPVLFLFVLVFGVIDLPAAIGGLGFLLLLFVAFSAVAVAVGSFALGGALGAYAKREGLLENV